MNFNNTNWHLYKTFIIVYETRNMSTAADILYVSRSAVSHNIKELSNQLGVTLFTATSKGVIPTGEANNLYPIVKNAITALVEAENNLQAFTSESKATIKIGALAVDVESYLLEYLKDFSTKYPHVKLDFYEYNNTMDTLAIEKLDFIIVVDIWASNPELRKMELLTVNGAFIASRQFLKNHGLTQKISLNEFSRLPMISYHSWADDYKNFAQRNNLPEPNFVFRANMAIANYFMIKNSVGIGYCVKEIIGKLGNADLVEVEVENYKLPPVTFVCVYNSLSRPARVFIDGLIEFNKNKFSLLH